VLRSLLRPLAALAALAGLAAYATIMLRGPQGLTALRERRQQVRTLEEQNASLTRDIEARKQRIERLKHDPSAQAVAVKKETGMAHPGDIDFKTPGQLTKPAASDDSGNVTEPPK